MIFKPYYYFETGCAAYLFGCGGLGKCAVVDAHERDLDAYAGRSEQAADQLRARGLTSVRSLCGGTEAWLKRAAQGA